MNTATPRTMPSPPRFTVAVGNRFVIPEWVYDLETFRRWATSDALPERARVAYLNGEIWVDPDMEQAYSHVGVKTRTTRVLDMLAEEEKLGRYFSDGLLLTNAAANVSNIPDGMFVSWVSFHAGKIIAVESKHGGCVEFQGTPDMVLEIVSDSSEKKDWQQLRVAYAAAGIPEYWIIDARKADILFEILRLTASGYQEVKPQRGGWRKSQVFGKSFRLMVEQDAMGPQFRWEVR
jgi:Uma2 family endonuclease